MLDLTALNEHLKIIHAQVLACAEILAERGYTDAADFQNRQSKMIAKIDQAEAHSREVFLRQHPELAAMMRDAGGEG